MANTTDFETLNQRAIKRQKDLKKALDRYKQSKDTKEKARNPLTYLGFTKRLNAPEIPGFKTAWVEDADGQIENAVEKGWQFVLENSAMPANRGEKRTGDPGNGGSPVSMSTGGGYISYLMKIPEELWRGLRLPAKEKQLRRKRQQHRKISREEAEQGMSPEEDLPHLFRDVRTQNRFG